MEEAHFTHCSQQRDQLYNLKHYQSFIFFTLKNFCLCFCNFFETHVFPPLLPEEKVTFKRAHAYTTQLQYDHFERTHLYLFIKSRDINPLKI